MQHVAARSPPRAGSTRWVLGAGSVEVFSGPGAAALIDGGTGLPSGPGEQRGEAEQHQEMPEHYPVVDSPGGSLAEK